MRMRGMVITALVICILGGLVATIFTPAIAATLTLPATSVAVQPTGTPRGEPTRPANGNAPQPTPMASGMTVLAQDTFQRPDQAFWGTASDHRTWSGDANTNQAFSIANHAGQISGAQGALQAILDVPDTDAELLVTGTVSQFDAQGKSNLGVVLRWQDAHNWYKALIDGNVLQILKDVNGKISVLSEHTFKAASGTNYSLRFRALGSNLFAKAWPSASAEPANWTLMVIDTQLTGGMSGVRVTLVPNVIIRITSFLETNVPNATGG